MKAVLALLLGALLLAAAPAGQDDDDPLARDGPDPNPAPQHGPYEHARGWTCSKVETNERVKNVQCACKEACENFGVEDHSCQTSCANPKKCHCHEDSSRCPGPDVMPAPKPKKGKR